MITFIPEIITKHAILAVSAIIQKCGTNAVGTLLTEMRLVATCAIGGRETEFAFFYKNTIPAILTFRKSLTITTIFRKPASKY